MQNFKTLGEELRRSGKAESIEKLAQSSDGQKISRMLKLDELKQAADSGDTAAMQSILRTVLETEEGKRLAEGLMKLMQD